MITDIRKHSSHYALLAGWLSLSVVMFFAALGNSQAEAAVIMAAVMGYLGWGLGHHYLIRDLSAKIAAEYLLMAILISAILVTVILNQ